MDLRGDLLLDHGRIATEPGHPVRTVAAHLWNRCAGDLLYEAAQETPCFAFFSMRRSHRGCGVHHWCCRDTSFWDASMGLSGITFES